MFAGADRNVKQSENVRCYFRTKSQFENEAKKRRAVNDEIVQKIREL